MPPPYFPLRWESTGDQWWYAAPIDWAAANGLYDLVLELLHLDTNLLIKLTSLRRIRRLETVWDDNDDDAADFRDVAKCRSYVARRLLHECEASNGCNSLIRAGYGGWLLYTAASAGDMDFVKELLERDAFLVFGEGEYGVTDIFYAAARSKNSEVFRLLMELAFSWGGEGEEEEGQFEKEMMNRVVHAAARGGNLEVLKEIIGGCDGALDFIDMEGSTVLHTAAAQGQIEVVKELVASYNIITCTDNQGNTALHLAAYRGHLAVVSFLLRASSSLASMTNKYGDTFLHMAVAGFRMPGFHRVDRQVELMKQLVSGKILGLQEVINMRNKDGRTAVHMAVMENIQSNLVELLMTAPSIDLNVRDVNGMTPLDLLKRRPRSASSEILIKEFIAAGGISNCWNGAARNALVSHLKGHAIYCSPGTSFRIPDAEIVLYTNSNNACEVGTDHEITEYSGCLSKRSELDMSNLSDKSKLHSVTSAARHLKFLLQWTRKKEKNADGTEGTENDPLEVTSTGRNGIPFYGHIPLRQKYSKPSLPNQKRIFCVGTDLPSPSAREKFAARLRQGVIQATPYFASPLQSFPSSNLGSSSVASPISVEEQNGVAVERKHYSDQLYNSNREDTNKKQPPLNKKLMNRCLSFGAQGLAVEDTVRFTRQPCSFRHFVS